METSYRKVLCTKSGRLVLQVIDFNEERYWGDCNMCGDYKRLDHAVPWYCGPTHDEIGSISTEYKGTDEEPAIVGGMCVCRECHDYHYSISNPRILENFFDQIAELIGGEHSFVPPRPYWRRWGQRYAGNGRFPGHGIIRVFGPDCIHVTLYNPKVSGVFRSPEAVLQHLRSVVATP